MEMEGFYLMVSDEDLMRSVQQGRTEAVEELIGRYHGPIHGYVVRFLSGHHMAEDLVQECFLRLCTRREQYQYPRPFKPWLYMIARNLCLNFRQSAAQRRESPSDGPEMTSAVSEERTPEAALEASMEADVVKSALDQLSDDHREVVILRFYHDMQVRDIAEVLSLPEGTVKSRLFYGIRKLQKLLAIPLSEER